MIVARCSEFEPCFLCLFFILIKYFTCRVLPIKKEFKQTHKKEC
jgi:hypothetical protein